MSWRAQGMRTWILQRLSALYMLLYLITFGFVVYSQPKHDYASWHDLFISPFSNIATLLFFLALLVHGWIGVRDILIDYVQLAMLRYVIWVLLTLSVIAMGIWISMLLFSVVIL